VKGEERESTAVIDDEGEEPEASGADAGESTDM